MTDGVTASAIDQDEVRRRNAQLMEQYEREVRTATSYTAVVSSIGYAGLITIWNGIEGHINRGSAMATAVLLAVSLMTFVLFEIAKSSVTMRAQVAFHTIVASSFWAPDFGTLLTEGRARAYRETAQVNKVQPVVFWVSSATGVAAAVWIACAAIANIVSAPPDAPSLKVPAKTARVMTLDRAMTDADLRNVPAARPRLVGLSSNRRASTVIPADDKELVDLANADSYLAHATTDAQRASATAWQSLIRADFYKEHDRFPSESEERGAKGWRTKILRQAEVDDLKKRREALTRCTPADFAGAGNAYDTGADGTPCSVIGAELPKSQ